MDDPTKGQPEKAGPGGEESVSVSEENPTEGVSVARLTGARVGGRSRALRKPEDQPGRVTGLTARDRLLMLDTWMRSKLAAEDSGGRVGEQTIALHGEGEKVILTKDGQREEVDLQAPGRRAEAGSRWRLPECRRLFPEPRTKTISLRGRRRCGMRFQALPVILRPSWRRPGHTGLCAPGRGCRSFNSGARASSK
jgi:hypothetical protein